MLEAVERALPADAAVCAAAVADWRVVTPAAHKMKKQKNVAPQLTFAENPDILARISQRSINRPQLVVGFAAETDDLLENATAKRQRKACDWIVANDVSADTGIMGGDENAVTLITDAGPECWPRAPKHQVAARLAQRIATTLAS
jgi:phosphopantothenoylcysteine decarboxylase/phosphopantothenate--cysteine ligase